MDINTFWSLIEKVDSNALSSGEETKSVMPIIEALAQYTEADIQDFQEILAQILYAIDGKTYLENAGESGGSYDGFLYLRCYVVARGKDFYDSVKANPGVTPKSLNKWCEPLLSVARKAWAKKTGNDASAWDCQTTVSYETGSNKSNW